MKQSNTSRYAYLAGLVDAQDPFPPTESEIYLAGLVDGEGCLSICRDVNAKGPNYFVVFSIANRDGAIMDWLFGTFGGAVYTKSNKGFNGERIPIYEWRLYRDHAVPIVKRILPFLRIKRHQAEVWLRMAERMSVRRGGRTKLSEHEIDERNKLFDECRSLKSHFPLCTVSVSHPKLPGD
jgi:hypothetical protein